jgi:hypothetical protein
MARVRRRRQRGGIQQRERQVVQQREPWRDLPDQDFARSVTGLSNLIGCQRWTAAAIIARMRGIPISEIDPRQITRLRGRGPGWLVDSGMRPTSRPSRDVEVRERAVESEGA